MVTLAIAGMARRRRSISDCLVLTSFATTSENKAAMSSSLSRTSLVSSSHPPGASTCAALLYL